MTPSPEERELMNVLEELLRLLRRAGAVEWINWFENDQRKLLAVASPGEMRKEERLSALDHILSAYGGMGSFNDLVLSRSEDDQQLDILRSRLWEMARGLRTYYMTT